MSQPEMERRIVRNTNDIESVYELLTQHTARFDAIDEKLGAHDARFDAHDARFDAHDARFDAHDARFDAHDARFDSLDRNVAEILRRLPG